MKIVDFTKKAISVIINTIQAIVYIIFVIILTICLAAVFALSVLFIGTGIFLWAGLELIYSKHKRNPGL